jgi:hypothetical protein
MQNTRIRDTKINTSYNFTKSIKDKERIILEYYKKLTYREQPKHVMKHKEKKRTLKKLPNVIMDDTFVKNEKDDNIDKDDKEREKDKFIKEEKEKKEIANKKLTQKRIVIMDD